MIVNSIQQKNKFTFGYKIENSLLMHNVFEYNKKLLNKGNIDEVSSFYKALTNIFKKAPKQNIFKVKEEIDVPWDFNDGRDILSLKLIVEESNKQEIITHKYKVKPVPTSIFRRREIYLEAFDTITKLANEYIINVGSNTQKTSFDFMNKLVEKMECIKFKNKKDALQHKLVKLENMLYYNENN